MTLLYFEGFETVGTEVGVANAATVRPRIALRVDDYSYGPSDPHSFFIQQDNFAEGYACNMGIGSSSGNNYLEIIPEEVQLGAPGPNTPTVVLGMRVHISSDVSKGATLLSVYGRFSPVGIDRQFDIANSGNNLIATYKSGVALDSDTVNNVFSLGVWHYVEIEFKCAEAADGGKLIVYIDGQAVLTKDPFDNNHSCSVEAYEYFRLGNSAGPGTSTDYTAYDDIYILINSNPLGACRVYSLPPNGDFVNQWTPDSGTINYTQVDENGANGSDYVTTDIPVARDWYNITNPSEEYEVWAAKIEAETKLDTQGTPSIKLGIKKDSNTIEETFTVDNSSYELFVMISESSPGGGSWTASIVEDVVAGYLFDNEIN